MQGAVMELLAGRATWIAFKKWRTGERRAPDWFAQVLADLIEARVNAGRDIVAELRAYRRPAQPMRGAMAVDPETGTDRRASRIGRRSSQSAPQGNGGADRDGNGGA